MHVLFAREFMDIDRKGNSPTFGDSGGKRGRVVVMTDNEIPVIGILDEIDLFVNRVVPGVPPIEPARGTAARATGDEIEPESLAFEPTALPWQVSDFDQSPAGRCGLSPLEPAYRHLPALVQKGARLPDNARFVRDRCQRNDAGRSPRHMAPLIT